MRHAKSSWSDPGLEDHRRPLNKRGRKSAPRIAAELVQRSWSPTHVISSDSTRTRETCELMQPLFEQPLAIHFSMRLYHGGVDELRDELHAVPDAADPVLFLGHNPGCQEIIYALTGESITVTTANAALLEATDHFENWADAVAATSGFRLLDVLRPKEL